MRRQVPKGIWSATRAKKGSRAGTEEVFVLISEFGEGFLPHNLRGRLVTGTTQITLFMVCLVSYYNSGVVRKRTRYMSVLDMRWFMCDTIT